jgi:protein gp37
MADGTRIEWTNATWNPVTGCSKVSPGCRYCYAERMAKRLQAMGQSNYIDGFEVRQHEGTLELPLRWKKPRRVFVCSMGDLFHGRVRVNFIGRVFATMVAAHWHTFQVLTKRVERLGWESWVLPWRKNIWMGVSVENEDCRGRIDVLRNTGAHVKFLSLEPLLGRMPSLDLAGIDWVIVGGETGPRSRPMDHAWVLEIRDQCVAAGVPFFFKAWGGVNKKEAGRLLEGKTWDEMPKLVEGET